MLLHSYAWRKAYIFLDFLISQLLYGVKITVKFGLMIALAKDVVTHAPDSNFEELLNMEGSRISNREMFWYLLDLELKRSIRHQVCFCLLTFNLFRIYDHENGKGLQTCYQALSHFLMEELRESDILGSLGEDQLGILLPHADPSVGGLVRSRIEDSLNYDEFNDQGYEVMIDQISFFWDGMGVAGLSKIKIPIYHN